MGTHHYTIKYFILQGTLPYVRKHFFKIFRKFPNIGQYYRQSKWNIFQHVYSMHFYHIFLIYSLHVKRCKESKSVNYWLYRNGWLSWQCLYSNLFMSWEWVDDIHTEETNILTLQNRILVVITIPVLNTKFS